MSSAQTVIRTNGFGKRKAAAVIKRAKQLGMTPQDYLTHLVEEDLAVSKRAKTSTFEELLGPGTDEDEDEIDRLVEDARARLYRESVPKK